MSKGFSIFGLTPRFEVGVRFFDRDKYIFTEDDGDLCAYTPLAFLQYVIRQDKVGDLFSSDLENDRADYCEKGVEGFCVKIDDWIAPKPQLSFKPYTSPADKEKIKGIVLNIFNRYFTQIFYAEKRFAFEYNLTIEVEKPEIGNVHIDFSKFPVLDQARLYLVPLFTSQHDHPESDKKQAEQLFNCLTFYIKEIKVEGAGTETLNLGFVIDSRSSTPQQAAIEKLLADCTPLLTRVLTEIPAYKNTDKRLVSITPTTGDPKDIVIKKSVYLENQKHAYHNYKDLFERVRTETNLRKRSNYEIIGINPTEAQERSLNALHIMLNKTNFAGNREPMIHQNEAASYHPSDANDIFHYRGILPVINFNLTEYYDYYGVPKKMSNRGFMEYDKDQRKLAKQALRYFGETKFIIVGVTPSAKTPKKGRGKKEPQLNVFRATTSLYDIIEGWEGVSQDEADDILQNARSGDVENQSSDRKVTNVTISFKPIWVKGILTQEGEPKRFLLQKANWWEEIRLTADNNPSLYNDKTGIGKPTINTHKFISWLHVQHREKSAFPAYKPKIKISWDKLARCLKMSEITITRNKASARGVINKQLRIAKELGYLLDFCQEGEFEVFTINRSRFPGTKRDLEGS